MSLLREIFEATPVVLAIVAVIRCGNQYRLERRRKDRLAMLMATICALILIVAQTSWFVTSTIYLSATGTDLANILWTVFNCTAMLTFITLTVRRTPNASESTTPGYKNS